MLDPDAAARALKSGETSPNAVVAGARVAYAALAAMYERCSKETVAAGPGAPSPRSTRRCRSAPRSISAAAEWSASAVAFAAKARDEWTRRRGLEGFHAIKSPSSEKSVAFMEIDDHPLPNDDGAPDVLPEDAVVAARRGAFGAFAALVARTQTKAKFYEKLFEGGAARWNALVGGGDAPLRLEDATSAALFATADERGYAGYVACSRFAPESREADLNDPARLDDPARINEPADPSLAFTLSATLSAGDPTLARAPGAAHAPRSAPKTPPPSRKRRKRPEGAPFGATPRVPRRAD